VRESETSGASVDGWKEVTMGGKKPTAYTFFFILSGVRLSPLGTAATTGLLYQHWMIDDCGAIGGINNGKGN
jgi:hypothetical protein